MFSSWQSAEPWHRSAVWEGKVWMSNRGAQAPLQPCCLECSEVTHHWKVGRFSLKATPCPQTLLSEIIQQHLELTGYLSVVAASLSKSHRAAGWLSRLRTGDLWSSIQPCQVMLNLSWLLFASAGCVSMPFLSLLNRQDTWVCIIWWGTAPRGPITVKASGHIVSSPEPSAVWSWGE